jgi:CelD/BcsL family acetyltransferase involved in cellulose biosynthesis
MIVTSTKPSLDCEVVTDFARLEQLSPEWKRIWGASPRSEVFQSFNWARAAWRAFADEVSLLTPVVYRGSEVVGILPLVLRGDRLEFLASSFSDYNDVICPDDCVAEVVSAAVDKLLHLRRHWKSCRMQNVAQQSRLACALPELRPELRRQIQPAFETPCSSIVLGEGEVVAELLRKQSLRRHEKSLRKMGDLNFSHLEHRDAIMDHLDPFFRQHIGRRAALGESSNYLEERARELFRFLVEEFDPANTLRFGVLTLQDRPIAYHFGFESKRKFVFYQSAFNIDLSRFAPGEVMLRQLFLYVQGRNLHEFDLTRGAERYKQRFANTARSNLTLHLESGSGIRRQVMGGIRSINGAIRESAYERAPLYNLVKTLMRRWHREQRLLRQGAVSYIANHVREFVREFIFARENRVTAHIEREWLSLYAGLPHKGCSVDLTTMSELAVVAESFPETSPAFEDYEARLAQNQSLYLVRRGTDAVQVWAVSKMASEDAVAERALLVEHCFTAPGFGGNGLRAILLRLSDETAELYVRCRERDNLMQELQDTDCTVQRRTHLRILHRFHYVLAPRDSVIQCVARDEVGTKRSVA